MNKEVLRKDDMPVTVTMFSEFRAEVNSKLGSMDAKFDGMNARLDGMDARLDGMDAKLAGLDAKIDGVERRLTGEIHSIKLLIETQTAQNAIALDGVRHALAEVAELRREQGRSDA